MATATLPAEQRRANPITVIHQNIDTMAPELAKALPAHVTVDKFVRVAKTAIINNPDLQNADRTSLFGAIGRLAQDGLLPDGREAAIVMFGGKAQAMPMIAGVLKKARQSGEIAKVSAQVVYESDYFVWKLGFEEDVEHNPPPLDKPRGKAIGAYATAVLKDGSRLLEVMSLEEIEKVRSVSRAKNAGPWTQWWGEMARKTVMRRLSKRLPMSTDLMEEFDRDPTMATEPQAIEHQPRTEPKQISRLDALEDQIGADGGDDATQQVDQDAQFDQLTDDETAETDADQPAHEPEGKPDEEHGEGFNTDAEHPARAAANEIIKATKIARDAKGLENIRKRRETDIAAMPDDLKAEVEEAFRVAEGRL